MIQWSNKMQKLCLDVEPEVVDQIVLDDLRYLLATYEHDIKHAMETPDENYLGVYSCDPKKDIIEIQRRIDALHTVIDIYTI